MSSIESTPHSMILSESLIRKPLISVLFTSKLAKWWQDYRCEASTTKQRIIQSIYINEFPSIKLGPFDAEFDSASNGDTFIHGKTMGKNFT